MSPPRIRLRTAPMIILAGIMIAGPLIASSPGDLYNSPNKVTETIQVTGAP